MQRKDMRRTDWKRILKRDYVAMPCSFQGIDGIASLIWIHQITKPLTVQNGDHQVTIVDEGMSWLQIALRDQYVWLTAMFDRQDRLLQIYFDLTDGNCLEPAENPTFEDLYLDIVMEPDCTLYVLDWEELDEALAKGVITCQQHARTVAEGEKLYQWLSEHGEEVASFCCKQRMKLKGRLENEQVSAR